MEWSVSFSSFDCGAYLKRHTAQPLKSTVPPSTCRCSHAGVGVGRSVLRVVGNSLMRVLHRWLSMITLFRIATLDAWTNVLFVSMYGCNAFGCAVPHRAESNSAAARDSYRLSPTKGGVLSIGTVLE